MMTDHERAELLTEARRFYQAAPVLLPLIERKKQQAAQKLILAYRQGLNITNLAAELSILTELEGEVARQEQTYRLMEEQNANRNDRK